MTEKDIQNEILREFGTRTELRIWRQNTGVAVPFETVRRALDALRRGNTSAAYQILSAARPIRFGVNGQADLSGLIAGGRRLEIEVKAPNGRQSREQKMFHTMIERLGGVYVLARSVDDVERMLQ